MKRATPGHLWLVVLAVSAVFFLIWNNDQQQISKATIPTFDRDGLHPAVVERIDERIDTLEGSLDSAASWGALAVVLDLHDLQEAAIECYQEAIARDPAQFRWPYFAGICATIGRHDQAIDFFASAQQLSGAYAPLLVRQAILMLQNGETEPARALFEQAVRLDDTLIQGHLGLARCFMIAADLDSAGRALDRCEQLVPQGGEVATARSKWWSQRGDAEQAEKSLRFSRHKPPREPLPDPLRNAVVMADGLGPQWWRERSRRLVAADRIDEALELWRTALAGDPDNPDLHYRMAQVVEKTGDKRLTIDHYLAATRGDPQMAEAFADFGAFLLASGNEGAAEKALRSALELTPDSVEVIGNLGVLLLSMGNSEEGMPFLEAARDAEPNNASHYFNLAMAHKRGGDNARASEQLARVLDLDPSRTRARFEWGVILAELGQLDAAAEQFLQIIAIEPTREGPWVNLVRAYLAGQRYADAITTLRSAREKLPKNGKIAADLAWLLATCPDDQLRNGAEAQEIAVILCTGVGSAHPSSFDIWAACLAELGDFEGAVDKAQQALILFDETPGDPQQRLAMEQRLAGYLEKKPHRISD